jgi:hypothetical protein
MWVLPGHPSTRQPRGMPHHADPDPPLPVLFTTAQALAAGPVPLDRDRFAQARIEHVHRAVAAQRRNTGSVIAFHSAALAGAPQARGHRLAAMAPTGWWAGSTSYGRTGAWWESATVG